MKLNYITIYGQCRQVAQKQNWKKSEYFRVRGTNNKIKPNLEHEIPQLAFLLKFISTEGAQRIVFELKLKWKLMIHFYYVQFILSLKCSWLPNSIYLHLDFYLLFSTEKKKEAIARQSVIFNGNCQQKFYDNTLPLL